MEKWGDTAPHLNMGAIAPHVLHPCSMLLPLGFMTITTMYKCVCICKSYNTGRSALPDILHDA